MTLDELVTKAATDQECENQIREMAARRATCHHETSEVVNVLGVGLFAYFCNNCFLEMPGLPPVTTGVPN